MKGSAQQTDILASIMTGLAGIRKIPDFTPKNRDLVELADAITEIKAAAAMGEKKARSAQVMHARICSVVRACFFAKSCPMVSSRVPVFPHLHLRVHRHA